MYSEYMEFNELGTDKKTKIWSVLSKSTGAELGRIRWYGAWRQYCFYPERDTIFNKGCMQDIIRFIELNNNARNF